jgi:hypothetical protein
VNRREIDGLGASSARRCYLNLRPQSFENAVIPRRRRASARRFVSSIMHEPAKFGRHPIEAAPRLFRRRRAGEHVVKIRLLQNGSVERLDVKFPSHSRTNALKRKQLGLICHRM